MKNKVYYGEYSLKHWIDLILKENILLPWYQRSFVWEKSQIENLINTFENNQFVPSIIIGAVKKDNEWVNYILDGQQRLTSVLFAKCNKYIDKKEFLVQRPTIQITQTADDFDEDDEREDDEIKMIKWNFSEIIDNKKFDSNELSGSFYKELLETAKNDDFFEEHFLGFAYIKPDNNINEEEQSKFYTDIFRNINTGGTKLTRLETRKSLYFLKENLKDFFAPEFLDNIKIETSSKEGALIDFIKYLSILSQYKGNNSYLYRYGGKDWEKTENYYRKYITAIVEQRTDVELNFDITYPTTPYTNERIEKLKKAITLLEIPKIFKSIIEMDMYFFGLVNELIYLNNEIDETKKVVVKTELEAEIVKLKNTENHKYNPIALKYLRARIASSLEVYKKYRK